MNNKLYIIGIMFLILLVPNVLATTSLYDDFNSAVLNSTKWGTRTTGGSSSIGSGYLLLEGTITLYTKENITTTGDLNNEIILINLNYSRGTSGTGGSDFDVETFKVGTRDIGSYFVISNNISGIGNVIFEEVCQLGNYINNYSNQIYYNASCGIANSTRIAQNSGGGLYTNVKIQIWKNGNWTYNITINGSTQLFITNNSDILPNFNQILIQPRQDDNADKKRMYIDWINITTTRNTNYYLDYYSPTPSNNSLYQNNTQNNIAGNVSGSGLNNISVYLSRSGTLVNTTFVIGNSTTFNYTNLANGIYTLNATAFNSTSQLWTENRIITIYNALLTINTNPSTSFSVNVGSDNYNSSGNQVQALVINGSTYNILLDATNYAYYTTNITITNATTTLTANLMPSNSINITFKDALTLATILQPLSITVTESTATNYSTSTGQIFIQNLTTGVNEFKVSNVNYTESRIYIDITNRSTQSIIMYLQQSGSILNLTLNWYDVNGAAIKNLYVTESVIGINGSVLVASYYTDIDGASYFSYNNAYYYSYDCESTIYDCVGFVLNPPRKSSYDITLGYLSSLINYSLPQVTGAISFNNLTNILTFNYVSTETGTHTYEYQVIKILNSQAVSICTDSSTSTSDTFTCDLSGYYDQIYVQGTIDTNTKFFGQWININRLPKLFDNLEQKDASYYAFFLLAIIIMGAAFFGVVAVLVTTVLGIILLTMIGLTNIITVGIIITIMIISIIIILGFKRR